MIFRIRDLKPEESKNDIFFNFTTEIFPKKFSQDLAKINKFILFFGPKKLTYFEYVKKAFFHNYVEENLTNSKRNEKKIMLINYPDDKK